MSAHIFIVTWTISISYAVRIFTDDGSGASSSNWVIGSGGGSVTWNVPSPLGPSTIQMSDNIALTLKTLSGSFISAQCDIYYGSVGSTFSIDVRPNGGSWSTVLSIGVGYGSDINRTISVGGSPSTIQIRFNRANYQQSGSAYLDNIIIYGIAASLGPTNNPSKYPSNIPSITPSGITSISPTMSPITTTLYLLTTHTPPNDPTYNPTNNPTASASTYYTSYLQTTLNPTDVPIQYTFEPSIAPFVMDSGENNIYDTTASTASTATVEHVQTNGVDIMIVILILAFICLLTICFTVYCIVHFIKYQQNINNQETDNHYVELVDKEDIASKPKDKNTTAHKGEPVSLQSIHDDTQQNVYGENIDNIQSRNVMTRTSENKVSISVIDNELIDMVNTINVDTVDMNSNVVDKIDIDTIQNQGDSDVVAVINKTDIGVFATNTDLLE